MHRSSSTSKILFKKDESQLSEYRKQEQIGSGGFSTVFRVVNVKTHQIYAMKVIPQSKLMTEEQRVLIDNEIKLHRSLNHTNIVKLFSTFCDAQNQYIILEHCKGGNLKDKYKQKGRFSESDVKLFLHQALSALDYIHTCGIVHRDIKLGNFLYADNNIIKICDFGLAVKNNPKHNYTVSGTQAYLAPELFTQKGLGTSPKIDIWALGVCAFMLLNGYAPFDAPTPQLQFERIKSDEFRFNPSVEISENMQDFISKTLIKDPAQRPSAYELLNHPLFVKTRHRTNSNPIITSPSQPLVSCFSEINKIGLAYLLVDGSVGIIFNDGYKFIQDPHQQFVQYYQPNSMSVNHVTAVSGNDIQKKASMLSKFSEKLRAQIEMYTVPSRKYNVQSPLRYVRKWMRDKEIAMFKFDNNDMQFNFNDGMKLIVYSLDEKLMLTAALKQPGKILSYSQINEPANIEYKNRFEIAKKMIKDQHSSILVPE